MTLPIYNGTLEAIIWKNMEDTIVYFCFSISSYMPESCFLRETENKSLKEQKHWYLTHIWLDKAFKYTFLNQALQSLLGGSLECKFKNT